MKANLNSLGVLSVEGDNPTEDYALKKWFEDYEHNKCKLQVLLPDENRPNIVVPHTITIKDFFDD